MKKNEALETLQFFIERNEIMEKVEKDSHQTTIKFVETGEEQCLGCWLVNRKYH